MKKVRLEAETGPNPRDGPRKWKQRREQQPGSRLLSRRECRSRGRLLHARNVPTFATSPNGAPGRFPVTPREVIFSPLFSAAASRHRVSLRVPGTAWPGSCLDISHVGEFRDICPEHQRARIASRSRRRDASRFVKTGIARRASCADPREGFVGSRAVARSVIGAAFFLRNVSVSPPRLWRDTEVGRCAHKADLSVIQSPTYRVEKLDETREPKPCLSACCGSPSRRNRHDERKCRSACRLLPTGRAFGEGIWRQFRPLIGGSPPRKRCYRERTECGRPVEDDHANAA